MTILGILSLFFTLTMVSCGGGNSGNDWDSQIQEEYSERETSYYEAENYTGIRKELYNATFTCEDGKDCPANVGLIFSNFSGTSYRPNISQCTGFLIADDIVATNSHCIPDYLKSSKSGCDSKIAIRFMKKEGLQSIFSCEEILDYSDYKIAREDYAFFRIKKTGRLPLLIKKNGMKDNQEIEIAKVSPIDYARGGILGIEKCKVALSTLLSIRSTSSWSRTGVGLGCKVIEGNSGSPVLNEDGDVIGIVEGFQTDKYLDAIKSAYSKLVFEIPNFLAPHFIFTNLSCISDPVTGGFDSQKCLYAEKISMMDCIDMTNNDTTKANVKEFFKSWSDDIAPIIVHEFITDKITDITYSNPVCVKPSNKYKEYDQYVKLKGLIGYRKENINFVYPRSVAMKSTILVDDEYRIRPDVRVSSGSRSMVRINLVKEGDVWIGSTNSTFSDWKESFDFIKEHTPLSLPECTDKQINSEQMFKSKLENGEILSDEEYVERYGPEEVIKCER